MKKKTIAICIVCLLIATSVLSLFIRHVQNNKDETQIEPLETEPYTTMYLPPGSDEYNIEVTDPNGPANEVAIAINPTDPDNLIAGAKDYTPGPGDYVWAGYYWSTDGGKSWGNGHIDGWPDGPESVLTGYEGSSDPVVCFDGDGNAYYSSLAYNRQPSIDPLTGRLLKNAIWIAKSTDKGATYPEIYIVAETKDLVTFHDKQWFAIDQENGNIYFVWAMYEAATAQIVFTRSTDGGESWSPLLPISLISTSVARGNQGAVISIGPDGIIYVTWIDFDDDTIKFSYSTDYGQTFSAAAAIADVVPIPSPLPNSEFRTPTLLSMAVDCSNGSNKGAIYIVWNDYRNDDADILLIVSFDGGATWTEPVRVNDDELRNEKDQFFPWVNVSPTGDVHVVFYDRRNDPENYLVGCYYAHSSNDTDFHTNLRITDFSFDGRYSYHQNGYEFIGDYIGVTSCENKVFPIWCDTRKEEADIYTAIILG